MKIKKTYQSIVPNNIVQNTYDNSENNVYSCDYINGITNYSVTEKMIGYADNGKPKYTITFRGNKGNNVNLVVGRIPEIDELIDIKGSVESPAVIQKIGNYQDSNNCSFAYIYKTTNDVYLNTPTGYNGKFIVIVEYTKTTDSGISLLSLDDEDPISVHYEEE